MLPVKVADAGHHLPVSLARLRMAACLRRVHIEPRAAEVPKLCDYLGQFQAFALQVEGFRAVVVVCVIVYGEC